MDDKKYPKFVVGSFILSPSGKLFLRTSPTINNKFTCINGKVEWGKTIEETLKENVFKKTNLEIVKFELIGLTNGLNISINDKGDVTHMIFADYKVFVKDETKYISDDPNRKYEWLTPREWLAKGKDSFGPYIYQVIEKLVN